MLWCFLWIVIMRWLTGFIVWLTILLLLVALGAGKYGMSRRRDVIKSNLKIYKKTSLFAGHLQLFCIDV